MISESDRDVLSALVPNHIFQGLTVKMEQYALARFAGLGPHDAYVEAYAPENCSVNVIGHHARNLDRDPRIVARVRQLTLERNQLTSLAPSLSRDFVLNGVMQIALLGEKESNRLNAYLSLGKVVGIDLFRDVHVTERRERSADEIDQELKDRLVALQRGLSIEGVARPVESVSQLLKPTPTSSSKDRRRKPMAR